MMIQRRFVGVKLSMAVAVVFLAVMGVTLSASFAFADQPVKLKVGSAYYTCNRGELSTKQTVELWYAGPTNKRKASYAVPKVVKFKHLGRVKVGKVVAIESYAFKGCDKARVIRLKGRVKTIGYKAFYRCKKLRAVRGKYCTISEVGPSAFQGCRRLVSVPELTNDGRRLVVGMGAFKGCVSLKSVSIKITKRARGVHEGDWGVTFDERAFSCCKSLRTVTLNKIKSSASPSLTICSGAFKGCKRLSAIKNHEFYYVDGDGAGMRGTPLADRLVLSGEDDGSGDVAEDTRPMDLGIVSFGDTVTLRGALQSVTNVSELSKANDYSRPSASSNADENVRLLVLKLDRPVIFTLGGRKYTLTYVAVAVYGLGDSMQELFGVKAEVSGSFESDYATSWCPAGVKALKIELS